MKTKTWLSEEAYDEQTKLIHKLIVNWMSGFMNNNSELSWTTVSGVEVSGLSRDNRVLVLFFQWTHRNALVLVSSGRLHWNQHVHLRTCWLCSDGRMRRNHRSPYPLPWVRVCWFWGACVQKRKDETHMAGQGGGQYRRSYRLRASSCGVYKRRLSRWAASLTSRELTSLSPVSPGTHTYVQCNINGTEIWGISWKKVLFGKLRNIVLEGSYWEFWNLWLLQWDLLYMKIGCIWSKRNN